MPLGVCLALNLFGLQLEAFCLRFVKPCMSPFLHRVLAGPALGLNFVLFVLFNSIAVIGLDKATEFALALLEQDIWIFGVIFVVATVYGNLNYMLDEINETDSDKKNK